VNINGEDKPVQVQYSGSVSDYASNMFFDDIADLRELFLTPLCDPVPLIMLCGTVPVTDVSGIAAVSNNFKGFFFGESLVTPALTFTALIDTWGLMYDNKDASFTDLPLAVDTRVATDPPHNCAICARQGEVEMQVHGRIMRKAGAISGVAIHGSTFHVGLCACACRARPLENCAAHWRVFW
jgi:hypothetical protein